jgi:outer membrane protein assembly factor BamB
MKHHSHSHPPPHPHHGTHWIAAVGIIVWLAGTASSALAANWPSWRGPNGDGTSPEPRFPTEWSATKNVRWRTALPEKGHSSAIVWDDKVFITQAVDQGAKRTLMAFDRHNGKQLWQAGPTVERNEPTHETNPYCAASPVTDGERVIVSHASAGIFCYDLKGKELWRADLGRQTHEWGQGSSPILHGDRCFVFHGPGEFSALHALDKRSGRLLWKVAMAEVQPAERFDGFAGKTDGKIGSFSTPLVVRAKGRDELIMSGPNQVQAFDPATGKELWHCNGMNPLVYTSPAFGEGMIVALGGFFGSSLAIRPGGSGDVTATERVWYEQRAKKHRIGTPIIKNGYVYFSNTLGIAECLELTTGKTVWEERLKASGPKSETWGSMVLAGDKLYVVNQSGDTLVVRAAPAYELIAANPLGELCNATPALSYGDIFIRTQEALWCISETRSAAAR